MTSGFINRRAVEIAGFLAHIGWDNAQHTPFEADF
jgi:hypothetical protein